MNALTVSLLLALALQLSVSLPIVQRGTSGEAEPRRRVARKVGNLNITMTPKQYMQNLFEEYAFEDENPSHDLDKPTDILCFPDKDIAQVSYRENSNKFARCTTYTQYVFQWSSMLDEIHPNELSINSSILRAYIQMISRHIEPNTTVSVNVTVLMQPRNNSTNSTTDWNEETMIVAGQETLVVGRDSNGWAELKVTEGIEEIWPIVQQFSEVQVILKAEVDCINQRKVPFNFVNPAEIPPEQENRRERHMDIQPFLVVFGNNQKIQAALEQPEEEEEATGQASNATFGTIGDMLTYHPPPSSPSKRSANQNFCSISPYIVDLHALGLTNVVAPIQINISKCSGICNDRATINRLGTNHAKIMTSIYNRENAQDPNDITATPPCCVPTKYKIVHFLMYSLDGTMMAIKGHDELVATECGCR